MNLIIDKWITAVMPDGTEEVKSLSGIFKDADSIVSLGGLFPEKVVVQSLLYGIAQDAMGGVFAEDTWLEMKPSIQAKCLDYLQKNQDRFDLYGKGRFGQVGAAKGLWKQSSTRFTRVGLSAHRPSGDSDTFTCHSAEEDPAISDAEIVICLLMNQTFAVGGLFQKLPLPNWTYEKGIVNKAGRVLSRNPSILAGGLVSMLEGECLLDTIWLNLVTEEQTGSLPVGRPFWMRKLSIPDDFVAYEATYMGRLLPMPYAIYLESGTTVSISRTKKWAVPVHPFLSYKVKQTGKLKTDPRVRISSHQEVWRQLGSSLSFLDKFPNRLSSLNHLNHYDGRFYLFAGGAVLGKKGAVCVDLLESCFSGGIEWDVWHSNYIWCFRVANGVARAMCDGLGIYGEAIAATRKSPLTAKGIIKNAALGEYWSKVSNFKPLLLDALSGDQSKKDEWTRRCEKMAELVYDRRTNLKLRIGMKGYAMGYGKMRESMLELRGSV